ncbi:MAG: sel1 repeat family protein [Ruminococcus flavefaciens]|nr:sel1 repeat family protein [Ruminococcus flavefaciens]MCM1230458.1 sel1 repeat family protein [Ruminococcus flavefaciens]
MDNAGSRNCDNAGSRNYDNAGDVRKIENVTDAIEHLINVYGRDILADSSTFMVRFAEVAPNLKKENSILSAALNQGIMQYFTNVSKENYQDSIDKVRMELSDMFTPSAIEIVVEAFAAAANWQDVVIAESDPEKLFQMGRNYYESKDYAKAFKCLLLSSEKGYVQAMPMLGECYLNGYGTDKDNYKAVEWFRKAADRNNGDALYMLGVCYANGYGVDVNQNIAFDWYKKSANHSNVQGMLETARRCENAYGCNSGRDRRIMDAIMFYEWAKSAGVRGLESKIQYLIDIL